MFTVTFLCVFIIKNKLSLFSSFKIKHIFSVLVLLKSWKALFLCFHNTHPARAGIWKYQAFFQSMQHPCETNKKGGLSLSLKLGGPSFLHMGPPESPPQASQCDCYAALWQTEHSGVFILYVETSHFVAEVIGQKQSLVLIGYLWRREMWCSRTAVR